MMFRKQFFMALAFTCAVSAQTQAIDPAVTKTPLALHHPLQDKNFYLFSLMQETPAVRTALLQDASLSKLTADRFAAEAAVATPADQPACTCVQNLLWTDAQKKSVADALRDLYRSNADVRAMIHGPLRQSGVASLFKGGSDEAMFIDTWNTEAQGINGILQTYGLGQAPLYPEIDSVSYDPASFRYREVVHQAAYEVSSTDREHALFFEESMHFALYLLQVNRRDEAARFEPMELGENAAAVAAVAHIDWQKYPYTVILIPGIDPEFAGVPLSSMGRMHVAAAARRYREGSAPFILLSGGYVHPSQTQFSEAMEMKRSLMRDYDIPESAIIVDPHARHTTTNFRNAAREIFRYGIPFDKPALVTSDLYQSQYIENANLPKRCQRELGYPCFLGLRRISPTDEVWFPTIQSLQQNPIDPLDP